MYYFAYGSNMNFAEMKKRAQDSKYLKRVKLEGYKIIYDGYSLNRKGAVANIIKNMGSTVWGALFEVDDECLQSLDRYEGYPKSYQRKSLAVQDDQGNKYSAIVYLRKPLTKGKPSDKYREIVLQGARNCGLPEEYINNFIET